MGDNFEVLAELCDRAEALACRLHVMIDTYSTESLRPEELFDKEIERARKQICSSYTTVLDGAALGAKKFLAVFKDRAPKIATLLSDDYNLLLEMMQFRNEARTVLTSTLQVSMDFELGTNTDLTEKLLGLVAAYTKLHLLLDARFYKSSEVGPQDVVILYQTAMKASKRGHDGDTKKLKSYLQQFCEGGVLRSVKDDLQKISEAVGGYLLSYYDVLVKLMNPENSTQKIIASAAFSIVDKLDVLGQPVETIEGHVGGKNGAAASGAGTTKRMKNYFGSARFYLDVTYLSQIKEWVLFGLMACPAVLQGKEAVDLLKLVASDGWLARVHRNKYIDVHEVWEEHFSFLKAQKTAAKYDGKAKEHMWSIEKDCMAMAGKFHAVRRTFLRNVMPQYLKVFKQCPGVLGPQFPAVLALLSLARTELEFYYLHRNVLPRKGGTAHKPLGWKGHPHDPKDWMDHKIVVLVSLAERLRHFCQMHSNIVSDYFSLCLKDVRAKEVAANRSCLDALKITHDDMEAVQAELDDATPTSDFLELRSAWHRAASKINDGWNPPERFRDQVHLLQVIMDVAMRQSRYVDMQAFVHSKTSSLKMLWWHATDVVEDFQLFTLNNDNRYNVDGSIACDGVRLFNAAVENSHPKVPEDRAAIGEASVQFARHLLKLICHRVAKAVLVNYNLSRDLKATTASVSEDVPAAARADVMYRNTDALHYMCRLAHGFSLLPSVVVYHTELIPRLYLREYLSAHLKDFILGTPKQHGLVEMYAMEPDRIFQAVNLYLSVLGKACDLAGVQHTSLVREVLREQVGSVGASIDARSSVMLSDGATLVSQVSNMFVNYINDAVSTDVTENNKRMATYCPLYEGFVQVGIRGKRGEKQTWLQTRFSKQELSNLMGLLGPTGVRFVQANLLERIFKPAVTRLMQLVHRNKDKIPALEIHISTNSPAALDTALAMEGLGEFMQSLGTVSILTAFRSMLYSALAHAGGKTPIIQQFCRLATRGVEFEVSSESMDLVSQACGIDPVADYLMQDALAAARASVLKSIAERSPAIENLGKSLAVLAAASYTSAEFWDTKVRFQTELGIFNNNAHLFGATLSKVVYDLITLEQSGLGRGPGTGPNISGASCRQMAAGVMKEHFRTASDLLMRLKSMQDGRSERHMPLQAMMVALQMSVNSSSRLVDQNFFEGVIPYKYAHFCWAEVVRGRLGTDTRDYRTKDPEELLYFA